MHTLSTHQLDCNVDESAVWIPLNGDTEGLYIQIRDRTSTALTSGKVSVFRTLTPNQLDSFVALERPATIKAAGMTRRIYTRGLPYIGVKVDAAQAGTELDVTFAGD